MTGLLRPTDQNIIMPLLGNGPPRPIFIKGRDGKNPKLKEAETSIHHTAAAS